MTFTHSKSLLNTNPTPFLNFAADEKITSYYFLSIDLLRHGVLQHPLEIRYSIDHISKNLIFQPPRAK
jgi:hypothetical protein